MITCRKGVGCNNDKFPKPKLQMTKHLAIRSKHETIPEYVETVAFVSTSKAIERYEESEVISASRNPVPETAPSKSASFTNKLRLSEVYVRKIDFDEIRL